MGSQGESVNGINGSENGNGVSAKKPRVLCFHGFRTSGAIMKKQIYRWQESVIGKLDPVFLDGTFPAQGKSEVEGIFDPPYYEWFQVSKESPEYKGIDECLKYIEDFMIKEGPFDGLLGFSMGGTLACGLLGLQERGVVLTKVPKLKFAIMISAAKIRHPPLAAVAYTSPIAQPTLHFIGEGDFVKPYGLELIKDCVDPVVVHHNKGHTVPRISEENLPTVVSFVDKIVKLCESENVVVSSETSSEKAEVVVPSKLPEAVPATEEAV